MEFPFKLRSDAAIDVVGFGTNAVDHLIRVSEFPRFGSKAEFTDHSVMAGGEVASTLAGLSRLGMRTAYAGRFGDDSEGELGLRSLMEAGVDITGAEIIRNARTQSAFILIDEASGERTILWRRDAKLAYTAADAPSGAVGNTRVLHMTVHDPLACIELAKAARSKGVIVSVDVDNVFAAIDDLLPLVDLCIASPEFTEKLLGIRETRTALREISKRFGCGVTGMTLGRNGSLVLCNDSFIESNGFQVPGGCIDTTGAGDAFRTGFLFGMLTGASVEESSRMANAVAALKCRGPGARTALPDKQELRSFLKAS
jgi:sulfofructose kinase